MVIKTPKQPSIHLPFTLPFSPLPIHPAILYLLSQHNPIPPLLPFVSPQWPDGKKEGKKEEEEEWGGHRMQIGQGH